MQERVSAVARARRLGVAHSTSQPVFAITAASNSGGENFGVVTRLKLRLHEVGTVPGGMLILPATPDVITSFVAEAEAVPDGLSTIASVMTAPPLPFVPPEAHGRPIVMAQLVHAGPLEHGRWLVDRFRALATPIVDTVRPMPAPTSTAPRRRTSVPSR